MTVYLTATQLETFNGTLGGFVRDRDGLEAAVARPSSGWAGVEHFPTIPEKAAVLLHSLASTQIFADGNKRTAWIALRAFLDLNGFTLKYASRIESEVFVLATATGLVGLEQATEWVVDHAIPPQEVRLELSGGQHKISDLTQGGDMVENIYAVGVHFYGPAILIPMQMLNMGHCTFHSQAGIESIMWDIPDHRSYVIGALGLRNCTFLECTFEGIGFAGPTGVLHQLLNGINV